MSVYLHLFHGRIHPNEPLDDWGLDGPVLGPLDFVHVTYCSDLKFDQGELPELKFVDDLVYYDGMYYADWSVFSNLEEGMRPELPTEEKAAVPGTPRAFADGRVLEISTTILGREHFNPKDKAAYRLKGLYYTEHDVACVESVVRVDKYGMETILEVDKIDDQVVEKFNHALVRAYQEAKS